VAKYLKNEGFSGYGKPDLLIRPFPRNGLAECSERALQENGQEGGTVDESK
jgi:hypothetical protein